MKNKAVNGMLWAAVDKIGTTVVQFIVGLIIARILLPSDYGVVGILTVFIAISETILNSGFSTALIQKQDRTNVDYSTAFFFNIGVGLFLYLCIFFSAPYIADFYSIPILEDVARFYSFSIVINSLTLVQTVKLSVDIDFRLQTIVSVVSVFFSGLVGVVLAYCGYGVWALVWQGLVACGCRMLLLWLLVGWRPMCVFSCRSFVSLFSYGSKLLCSSLINTLYINMYTLVIGKSFSGKDVGLFNRGQQFADLPVNIITNVVMNVSFPVLSQLQNDDEALRSAYRKFLTMPLFLLYPLIVLMIILAEPFIGTLLKQNWMECVPFLQILCFGAMWSPLTTINLNLLYVKGRTDKVLKLEFYKKPIGFAILFATIPFGIYWMCAGRALYSLVAFAINCHYTHQYINLGFRSQVVCLLPILAYCAVMSVVVEGVDWSLQSFAFGYRLRLIVGSLVGFMTYISAASMSKSPLLRDIYTIACQKLFDLRS